MAFSAWNAHTENLLAKDLLSRNVVSCENMVLKYIKGPGQNMNLTENGGSKVDLIPHTCWFSQRDACLFLTNNEEVAADKDGAEKLSSFKSLPYDSAFLKKFPIQSQYLIQ